MPTGPASTFVASNAGVYDQMMGRFSRRLALRFLDFTGFADGERVLDVGCGTGSLMRVLLGVMTGGHVSGLDYSPAYVAAAQAALGSARVSVQQGDAVCMPYADGSFDRALSQLVLKFIPNTAGAAAEMCRVVRPGGVVAVAVWDLFGGLPSFRTMMDTLAALDPAAEPHRRIHPVTRPGELHALWLRCGLHQVEQTALTIRLEYANFSDYWGPIEAGESPIGGYLIGLPAAKRQRMTKAVRAAYLCGEPDGPRSFAATAQAVRGVVPG